MQRHPVPGEDVRPGVKKQVPQAQLVLHHQAGSVYLCLTSLLGPHPSRTSAGTSAGTSAQYIGNRYCSLARLKGCSRSIRPMRPLGLQGVLAVCASLHEMSSLSSRLTQTRSLIAESQVYNPWQKMRSGQHQSVWLFFLLPIPVTRGGATWGHHA